MSSFLIWGEGRGVSRGQAGGGSLGGFAHPLVVLSAGVGACAVTLLLLPALQKWHLGGLGGRFVCVFFVSLGPEFACVCTQLCSPI